MDEWNSERPKLKIPCYPGRDSNGTGYDVPTLQEHIIYEYTGLNVFQIAELELDQYLRYFRDGYITRLNQTEAGQKYLNECWILEQTEIDGEGLLRQFGKE